MVTNPPDRVGSHVRLESNLRGTSITLRFRITKACVSARSAQSSQTCPSIWKSRTCNWCKNCLEN